MTTTPEYDAMVERIRAEKESKGFKPTKMTEAETKAEIERIQDGAKSSFEEPTISQIPGEHPSMELHIPGSYITKSGRVMKSKPGRKKGSKNKPKVKA